jgi:hypothetical protein
MSRCVVLLRYEIILVVSGASYAPNVMEITGWKLGLYDAGVGGGLVVFQSPSGQMPLYYLKLGHDCYHPHIPQFIVF